MRHIGFPRLWLITTLEPVASLNITLKHVTSIHVFVITHELAPTTTWMCDCETFGFSLKEHASSLRVMFRSAQLLKSPLKEGMHLRAVIEQAGQPVKQPGNPAERTFPIL
ncbi:hypothetical protein HYPDE_23033 [Hyphomicrobium denitrificans 1NES1]|uniref:Uncharacterized protein n=1 Tax=Hyphomicrobium denitrificans 1NES1 TaxID=670307 RepID=N0B064_9HYPH|nr:hypothetical protein [Hyphomicrobium denitrificans]AGK56293.1 hypothetical protein HYPDE_23033 [Hyphomicrobium denitrificans 1NES1]